MTLTLDVPESVAREFRAKAARRGVPPEKFFVELVESSNAPESTSQNTLPSGAAFLALLDELEPRIAAGTLRPITSDDISQAVEDSHP